MKADMKSKKSMLDFLSKHEEHHEFNSPHAYSHCVKIISIFDGNTLGAAQDNFDELYDLFESLVDDFEKNNHGLKIFQTGRMGGHIELYEDINTFGYRRYRPIQHISKSEADYPEEYDMEDLREIVRKVKAFDTFYDELRKELNKYAEELKSHAEA